MKVAQEILSFCTRCRMDLSHTIVAMQGDRVVRVQCKTCRSDHSYRSPKGATEPLAKGAATARTRGEGEKKTVITVEAEWEKRMLEAKNKPARPYDARTSFQIGDKIAHPTFGEGVVEKTIYPNKVEITFRYEIKTLVHKPAEPSEGGSVFG